MNTKILHRLGEQLRESRKRLGLSSIATAEAAEISRVTLYRIERGEASVAIGAYLSVISALGLKLELIQQKESRTQAPLMKLPKKIRVDKYKQLKRIAWQLKGSQELTPQEVLDIYERNWKHIDAKNLDDREKKLIRTLLKSFGRERLLV